MIAVLADDLSGAAELAGAARQHGLTAEVQTRFSADTTAEVVCVDTDTRQQSADTAAQIVAETARTVLAARPAWFFKKCDSVLRGSVLAEARALAAVTDADRIAILSANPRRSRIVRRGRYYVEGQPLDETIFARDPTHPRTTAVVADLLGGSLDRIEIPDAETFSAIARIAADLRPDTLPVGGVDFFAALLEARLARRPVDSTASLVPPAGGITLAVCGSLASWLPRRGQAEAAGLPVFTLPHDPRAISEALRSHGRALLGIGNGPATHDHSPAALAEELARSVAAALNLHPIDRLLLEGGATAIAVLHALNLTRLCAIEGAPTGIGILSPISTTRPLLYIKPGSYAWPASIWPP